MSDDDSDIDMTALVADALGANEEAANTSAAVHSGVNANDVEKLLNADDDEEDGYVRKKKSKKEKKRENREKEKRKRRRSTEEDDEEEDALAHISDDEHEGGTRLQFIDDAASSGESDETASGPNSDEDVAPDEYDEAMENLWKEREKKKPIDILRKIQERYLDPNKKPSTVAPTKEPIVHNITPEERFSTAFLPKETDPKVFAVKVRPGFSRILVTRLTNKCHAYLHGKNHAGIRQDLGIISVFAVDHVKEWIYVEAHRKRFVDGILQGMENVFRFKTVQVDPKDLMQLFERQYTNHTSASGDTGGLVMGNLQAGKMLRVKTGMYAGDIAIVKRLEDHGRKVILKLVPREDFIGKPFVKRSFKKGDRQLPQRFFVAEQAIDVRTRGNDVSWGDLTFDKEGYLLRSYSLRQLSYGPSLVKPTLDELKIYFKNDKEKIISIETNERKPNLAVNDMVMAQSGQSRGIVGRLTDIRTDGYTTLTVEAAGGRSAEIRVRLGELVPHFEPGVHIVVEAEEFEGDSGTVVFSTPDRVVYISNDSMLQRVARPAACRACTVKLIPKHSVAGMGFALDDLVILTTGQIGCVVRVTSNAVNVLKQDNTLEVGVPSMVKQRIVSVRSCTDKFENTVKRNDSVKVIASNQYQNVKASVVQIYGDCLFVRSGLVKENAGIFAVSPKSTSLIGGVNRFKHTSVLKQASYYPRAAHPATIAPPRAIMSLPSANALDDWDAKTQEYVDLE